MRVNMGTTDRRIRAFIVAPILIVLSLAVFGASSVAGIVALILAAIMLATSAVGSCPLYMPFGINTRDKPAPGAPTSA